MAQFLRDPEVLRADVIAIQEPWRNPYSDTTHHPALGSHQLLYPTADDADGQRARVALYISRKINPRTWKHTCPPEGINIILGDFNLHHPAWSERDACHDPTSAGETTTTNDDADDTSRDRQTCTDRKAPELLEFADSRLLDL
ncbi:hypothetical protein BDV35DRAFT_398368 [Aspergillus flavus]|uniref:Endonuclease/exonuclease/phosphatase domain-containing protein n=1 Tax=Aspergillus flavus TaxID=5059 RepID=A0A5N6GEA7_ASPFL|nr:hypothetical protein BDV35DRAFT_398368 [Aspergillus flavus]